MPSTELLQQRNNEGESPLDALQANLEDSDRLLKEQQEI
jgi:hypothetical protein